MMDWKTFWDDYRSGEKDLFVQVGKTVAGKPITPKEFNRYLLRLRMSGDLRSSDHLLDLCCGNGLVTTSLREEVTSVVGIDFCGRLIEEACRLSGRDPSVEFFEGESVEVLSAKPELLETATKVLMSDSLGYFNPRSYCRLISTIFGVQKSGPMRMLITGIPMVEKRRHFHDTPSREFRYQLERVGLRKNSGMGRWWRERELTSCLESLGLHWRFDSCDYRGQRYRSDLVIYNPRAIEGKCVGKKGFAYWGTSEKGFAIHVDPSRIGKIDVQTGSQISEGFWNTICLNSARFEVDPDQATPDPSAIPIIRAWVTGEFESVELPCRYSDDLLELGFEEIFYNPLKDHRNFFDSRGLAVDSAAKVILDHTNARDGSRGARIFAKHVRLKDVEHVCAEV